MNLWALLKKIASHGMCSWHFCLDHDQFQMATAIFLRPVQTVIEQKHFVYVLFHSFLSHA